MYRNCHKHPQSRRRFSCRYWILMPLIIFHITGLGRIFAGGFELRISPETGIFSQSAEGASHDFLFGSASLSARYKYKLPKQQFVFDLKFRPEFYSGSADISVLNINGQASYRRSGKKVDMEITLSRKQMNYYEGRYGLYANITQAWARTHWKFSPVAGVSLQPKFSVRSLTGDHEHKLSSAMMDLSFNYRFRNIFVISAGPSIEIFRIHIPYRAEPPSRNKGITAGPSVSVNYQDESVLQCSYAIMKRISNPVNENSIEHRIHGLWGRPITKKWSAFFYAEYTFRDFRKEADRDNELFYSLTDIENRIFARISYEWKNGCEWFLKAGYLSYGLYQSSARLSGVTLTTGFDFKF